MTTVPAVNGPLKGITVVEMAGLGPAPLAALMLAEMGARVLRIERKNEASFLQMKSDVDYNRHGRSILKVDLKNPGGRELVLELLQNADVLIEGFRPGVMERLGLGPEPVQARNPRLIYGRITGFGQDGPLAGRAGHDLTYLAYSGVLNAIGLKDSRPTPPLNFIGDYGGGTMFLIAGVLAALVERATSGKGQVIDTAMIDGASMLSLPLFAYMASGLWQDRRGSNLLDTGAPFYDTYETADGLYVAVACLEPQFFAEFARLLPLDQEFVASQYDRGLWPEMHAAISTRLKQENRAYWSDLYGSTDACVAPVLSFAEAQTHPHNIARSTYTQAGRLKRPQPAPRLSRSALTVASEPIADDLRDVMTAFGVADAEQAIAEGIVS